jgi:hypothetical protein
MRRWLPNEKVVANGPRLNNRRVRWRRSSLYNNPLLFVIPRVCNFIGFEKKLMLKTKGLGASKVAKNQ